MITISASYVSGDRDNHAVGLRIAVCSLFADVATKLGLNPDRRLTGPNDDTVLWTVTTDLDGLRKFQREFDRRGGLRKLYAVWSTDWDDRDYLASNNFKFQSDLWPESKPA